MILLVLVGSSCFFDWCLEAQGWTSVGLGGGLCGFFGWVGGRPKILNVWDDSVVDLPPLLLFVLDVCLGFVWLFLWCSGIFSCCCLFWIVVFSVLNA